MPRPRLTYEQADVRGATSINKGRFTERAKAPKTQGSVGSAPKYFDAALKKVWKEISASIPPGVAGSSDRQVIEMAARLLHQFRTDPLMQSSRLAILMQLLSRLGMDPQARTRLQVEGGDVTQVHDPVEEFHRTKVTETITYGGHIQ